MESTPAVDGHMAHCGDLMHQVAGYKQTLYGRFQNHADRLNHIVRMGAAKALDLPYDETNINAPKTVHYHGNNGVIPALLGLLSGAGLLAGGLAIGGNLLLPPKPGSSVIEEPADKDSEYDLEAKLGPLP